MALPKLTSTKFNVDLPYTKTNIEFRPFLVKEEKTLLMTQDEGNDTILNAMAKIVESCVDNVSNGYQIPLCDLEYLFCMPFENSYRHINEQNFFLSRYTQVV